MACCRLAAPAHPCEHCKDAKRAYNVKHGIPSIDDAQFFDDDDDDDDELQAKDDDSSDATDAEPGRR